MLRGLGAALGLGEVPVGATRRNVVTEGVDLNTLIGAEFTWIYANTFGSRSGPAAGPEAAA